MTDVLKVADGAEMIVNGYAFTKCDIRFLILIVRIKRLCYPWMERRWRQPWMTSKYRL